MNADVAQCMCEYWTVDLLYLFLFTFWMVYLYFVKDYGYWEQRKVPHVPAVFPLGSLTKVVIGMNHDETLLNKIYIHFKMHRFVGFINVREPRLMIREPELINTVMNDKYEHFNSRGWVKIHPNDYLLANLMAKSRKDCRAICKKITPAQIEATLSRMYGCVWQSSSMMQRIVEKQMEELNAVDVKDVLTQFTMKVFDTFGTSSNTFSEEDYQFYRTCRETFDGDFKVKLKQFIYQAFPLATKIYLFDMCDSVIKEAVTRKVVSSVKLKENGNSNDCDFLSLLIKGSQHELNLGQPGLTENRVKEGLTMEEIISQSFTFFSFGYEKPAKIAQFCLYELACNDEIQEQVYQEVLRVFEKNDNHLKHSTDLDDMKYLDKVVNETLRRYPVISSLYRQCTRTFKIPDSDLVIEKGLRLCIPLYSLHHDPEYYPRPYTFDPERFAAHSCQKRHPCVFIPSGHGPRKCTGYRFGVMRVKLQWLAWFTTSTSD